MRQALMMELKSAGEDLPELRKIARRVIDCALNDEENWSWAVKEMWDRLDGKAPVMVTDDAREFRKALDMSDDELIEIIERGRSSGNSPEAQDDPSQLH